MLGGVTMVKIMIVDDSAFMRKIIKNALVSAGYSEIIEVSSGSEAVEQYKSQTPNLVFMDILMPGLSGTDALKGIVASNPNANVVMCSSMGQESVVTEAIQIGAKDFIVKPFTPDKIIEVVKKILGV